MIAYDNNTRKRRTEVLERLALVERKAWRSRVPRRGPESGDATVEGSIVEQLSLALVDLGPVFSAYGLYLSTRGDLLTPADRRCLAAIGQDISPMSPSDVRAIVRTESGKLRVSAGPSPISEAAIASLDAEPFDTRLLIQRHYGRLSDGTAVVVR